MLEVSYQLKMPLDYRCHQLVLFPKGHLINNAILNKANAVVFEENTSNQHLIEEEEDKEIEESDIIADDKDYVPFKKSECECEVCSGFNSIEEQWDNWVPHNQIEIILKNAVLKIQ